MGGTLDRQANTHHLLNADINHLLIIYKSYSRNGNRFKPIANFIFYKNDEIMNY